MTKHNTKDLTRVKGGLLPAGLNLESVGSFTFSKMLFPKPIPHEECDEQIFHYQAWMQWNDLRRQQKIITLHQWHYLNTVADCWIMYYKKCKEFYTRQYEKNNNNI
jgi:hypothetical protein